MSTCRRCCQTVPRPSRAAHRCTNTSSTHADPRCSRTFVGTFNTRSVGSKTTAIYDRIVADRLHLCAVVETWLDAVESPQLIACTLPGYSYIEKARPRSASAALTTRTNHGGLCLFYASFVSTHEVPLPVYNSGIEVLTVYLRRARRNALAVVIYRPPTPPSVHF